MANKKYTIRKGDTWESIAKKYGISANELARRNKRVLRPTAGIILKIPGEIQPQSYRPYAQDKPKAPGAPPGSASTGSTGGPSTAPGYNYNKQTGEAKYKYNAETGRNNVQSGKWLPTVAYNAWKGEKDSHFVFNPKNGRWEARKGKAVTPGWDERKATVPYKGAPPPNWAKNYHYMVNAEKGQYWYWDEYDWKWKLNKTTRAGGGGGGGGGGGAAPKPEKPPTRDYQEQEYPTQPMSGGAIWYPDKSGVSAPSYRGLADNFGSPDTAYPAQSYITPQYIGAVNWRF